jgi:hypothetical protein
MESWNHKEWEHIFRLIFAFFYGKEVSKWPNYAEGMIKDFAQKLAKFYYDGIEPE